MKFKSRFHYIWIAFLVFVLPLKTLNAATELSDKSRVSLITCSAGPDLYEAFGHTAIRVYDPGNGINQVYNYGIFSFDQPDFYLNFAKGHLWYRLGINDFDRFVYTYQYYERSVYEQILNFDLEQRQTLYDSLEHNFLPENRYYLYNYFYHNCSTIPRDIIEYASGNKINYRYTDKRFEKGKSIRQLVDEYIVHNSWGNFGIDLALGAEIDKEATLHQYLYLPEYLMSAFESATISKNGEESPLVLKTLTHYQSPIDYLNKNISPGPITVFWLFFLLVALITAWNFKSKRAFKGFDFLLFLVLGLNGSMLFFISFFTDHTAAENYNLLWSLPTHLLFAFVLLSGKNGNLKRYYSILSILLCVLLFADNFIIIPQDIHPAVIPIMLVIIIRSIWIYYQSKLQQNR